MDREDYWLRKEAEIGETVDAKFYCTYLRGDWPVKGPLTGVLYFSKSTLYFQSFYSAKSLASMFQPRRQEGIYRESRFPAAVGKFTLHFRRFTAKFIEPGCLRRPSNPLLSIARTVSGMQGATGLALTGNS